MNLEFRHAVGSNEGLNLNTTERSEHVIIEKLLQEDQMNLTCTMCDRLVDGDTMPVNKPLKLDTIPYLKNENFLGRRKSGIIYIDGKGIVSVDNTQFLVLDKQVALSPEWSIPSVVGTSNYSFILGMAGENVQYDDMILSNLQI